jgi:hypothetical protein
MADPPWIPNVMVSDDPAGSNQDEVCIAVWQNYVFAYFNDYRVPLVHAFFARSIDGGLSWQPNYQMPQDSASTYMGDPVIAMNDSGTLFLCCCDFNRYWIYVTRSTDFGTSWLPTQYVSPGISRVDKPWISTKGSNVYVVWDWGPDPIAHIYITKSTDYGATYGPVYTVDNASTGTSRWGPIPRELDDGTVLVSWGCDTRSGVDTVNGVYCARSIDGGNTFTEYLITNTKFRYSSTSPRLFVLPPLEPSPTIPQDVYTVFNDGPAQISTDRVNLNVYATRSTDGGITWQTRIKVNDDSTAVSDTMQQFMPWMTVDYRGYIHAIWYDGRNHSPGSNRYDVYYSYSADRGITWSVNEQITDASFVMNAFCGDYIGLDTDSQYVYASWCDTRNSSTAPDIYFSRRPLPVIGVEEREVAQFKPGIKVFPNPMKSSAEIRLPQQVQSQALCRIYNTSGQLIRTIPASSTKNRTMFIWNACDDKGQSVPNGVYFCELSSGKNIFRQKIVKVD